MYKIRLKHIVTPEVRVLSKSTEFLAVDLISSHWPRDNMNINKVKRLKHNKYIKIHMCVMTLNKQKEEQTSLVIFGGC